MKKILIILAFLSSVLNAQKLKELKDTEILEITFDIYVEDKKLDIQYYFEMNADSMDIHFKTTQGGLFTCLLTKHDNYCFEFRHLNCLPVIININGRNQPKRNYYPIKLVYK